MFEEFELARISRSAPVTFHRFKEYFHNFDQIPCVVEIFGEKTGEVLENLRVEFYSGRYGFMSVSDVDGHLLISSHYLRNGDLRDIYLDIIHELVHVKQYMQGLPLFDDRFSYIDRPTEIEAYTYAVREGRRIGMKDDELIEYLRTPWLDEKELAKLAYELKIRFESDTPEAASG